MSCETIRQMIHDAHDGELAGELPESVRAHIAGCAACRELEDDLETLTQALRSLPRAPLPPEALDAVWRDTIRARPSAFTRTFGSWRLAAAAVFLTAFSTATLYVLLAPATPSGPTPVELARASAQAEMVFGYTARALAATRDAATERVLASRVSPAVRGVAASHPSRRP
jgi:predicted anti-sigma-YlaC factor YlaD